LNYSLQFTIIVTTRVMPCSRERERERFPNLYRHLRSRTTTASTWATSPVSRWRWRPTLTPTRSRGWESDSRNSIWCVCWLPFTSVYYNVGNTGTHLIINVTQCWARIVRSGSHLTIGTIVRSVSEVRGGIVFFGPKKRDPPSTLLSEAF
jgi:hypothetical protein